MIALLLLAAGTQPAFDTETRRHRSDVCRVPLPPRVGKGGTAAHFCSGPLGLWVPFPLGLRGDDKIFLGKDPIALKDVVVMDDKMYIRASRLERGLSLVWRFSADGQTVGVMREGVGGGAIRIGRHQDALVHSKDLFFSLDALEKVLNAKVSRGAKIVIDPKAKAGADPAPRLVKPVPGDRMVDFVLPPARGDEPVQLAKHKGKRILFVMWASWDASRTRLREWQQIQAKYRNEHLAVVACAVGAEGGERVRGCVPSDVVYSVAQDPHWRLVSVWDPKAFPQWVLVDELGFIRAQSDMQNPSPPGADFEEAWGTLGKPEDSRIKAWIPDDARSPADLERELAKGDAPALRLALSRALWRTDAARAAAEARKVLEGEPEMWEAAIHAASALWKGGRNDEGVAVLREYLKRKDMHTLVRRQKWAVQYPERIYAESLDEGWLRAQEEKERGGE